MPLFLFNYSTRRLHGVFEAASDGGFNIDPYAWENVESTRSGRYSKPVSRYPAQVRVQVRIGRPPLEEDTFRPVLDHLDGHKFRLELTSEQVQQLLHLFGAISRCEKELMDSRKRENFYHTAIGIHEHESPRSGLKSDSDCYSECSSRGTNFGEDEWTDEAPNENGMYREPQQMCYPEENVEGLLRDRLSHMALDGMQSNYNGILESKFDEESLYSVGVMSGLCEHGQTSPSDGYDNGQQMPWKGDLRRAPHCPTIEMFNPANDSTMFTRLQDFDPAVNSGSINCMQACGHESVPVRMQDNVAGMPMILSTLHSPFAHGEDMVYIPVQMVPCQQREPENNKVHSKLNDPRRLAWGRPTPSSKKQVINQDKVSKQNDARFHKQHPMSDNQQPLATQPQKLQLSQVLVPFCLQGLGPVHEPCNLTTFLSPVLMSPQAQALPFAQPLIDAVEEDSDEGYEAMNDAQLHQDGLQNLLQNGHYPILLMPSVTPRMPVSPPLLSAGFVEALHFDILHFARLTRPSAKTKVQAAAAIDCVRKGVKMVWPDADVEVFGSFATGLCLHHSDVDLAVVDAPLIFPSESLSTAQASALLIRKLASALGAYEWCESINVLDSASMPVLKCHCRPNSELLDSVPSIAVDITIGGMRSREATRVMVRADDAQRIGKFGSWHTGGTAREYVLQKIQDLPALGPLVLLLKSFLLHKGLSNVYSGGLGSFSLTLLVAFYLERIPISKDVFLDGMSGDLALSLTASSPLTCTPEVSEDSDILSSRSWCGGLDSSHAVSFGSGSLGQHCVRRAADLMGRVLSLWDSGGSPYLGTLLLGFLQTFGFELDLACERIVLKGIDGSPGGIFKRDDRHIALWIDDPLRPGVNVGAGSFGMFHVQAVFREMLQGLVTGELLPSPLCCNEQFCEDLAAMVQLPYLSRLMMEADEYQ